MYRFIVNILMVTTFSIAVSAQKNEVKVLEQIGNISKSFLCVTVTETDTVWSFILSGRYLKESMLFFCQDS